MVTSTETEWPLATLPVSQMNAKRFYRQFFLQHLPVLVTNCLEDPTSSLLHAADMTWHSLLTSPLLHGIEAEISACPMGEFHTRTKEYTKPNDEKGSWSAAEAAHLLASRKTSTEGSDAASPSCRQALYAKLALTDIEPLMDQLGVRHFLTSTPCEPVTHPMLLCPGKFFCWAFVGEEGSGSPTHVDVMGSDAWLVVLEGEKIWKLVHPMDKHLVTCAVTGQFADLFDIDPVKFPEAHRARITTFTQRRGDAIYVPSDAPHAVRNVAFSSSITFNFMLPETMDMWAMHMERVVQKSDTEESGTGIVDFVLVESPNPSSDAAARLEGEEGLVNVVTFRSFLPSSAWEPNGTSRIVQGDRGCRARLAVIQEALRQCCAMEAVHASLRTVGLPVAYEVRHTCAGQPPRIVIHFESDEASIRELQELFGVQWQPGEWLSCRYGVLLDKQRVSQTIFGAASSLEGQGTHNVFSLRSSHVGPFPDFPPISSLLKQTWYFDTLFEYSYLPLVVRDRVRDASQHPTGAQAVHPQSTWHYSRFRWRDNGSASSLPNSDTRRDCKSQAGDAEQPHCGGAWQCTTYLFYSSPYIDGPVSLHPLREDATLQTLQVAEATSFDLHFEEFTWNLSSVLPEEKEGEDAPCCLLNLGDHLMRAIMMNVMLPSRNISRSRSENHQSSDVSVHNAGAEKEEDVVKVSHWFEFVTWVGRHRSFQSLPQVDFSSCGIEKCLALVLYFSCRPNLAGFTYSHTFSAVEEPATICLTGAYAETLLDRVRESRAAQVLRSVCHFLEPPLVVTMTKEEVLVVPTTAASTVEPHQEEKEELVAVAEETVAQLVTEWCSSECTSSGDGSATTDKAASLVSWVEQIVAVKRNSGARVLDEEGQQQLATRGSRLLELLRKHFKTI